MCWVWKPQSGCSKHVSNKYTCRTVHVHYVLSSFLSCSYQRQSNNCTVNFIRFSVTSETPNGNNKKCILTNKFFLFPKLSLQDFQSTFYPPWWFQQRLRTISSFQALSWSLSVTSFPGSYEATWDKILVTLSLPHLHFQIGSSEPQREEQTPWYMKLNFLIQHMLLSSDDHRIKKSLKQNLLYCFPTLPSNHPFFPFKLPNSLLYAPASRHCQEFLTLDLVISASSISFKRMQTTAQQTASQLKKCFP